MQEVRYVKVYPRLWAAKGLALCGVCYVCVKAGRLIQKLIDGYNYQTTVSFNKKEQGS